MRLTVKKTYTPHPQQIRTKQELVWASAWLAGDSIGLCNKGLPRRISPLRYLCCPAMACVPCTRLKKLLLERSQNCSSELSGRLFESSCCFGQISKAAATLQSLSWLQLDPAPYTKPQTPRPRPSTHNPEPRYNWIEILCEAPH